MNTNISSIVKQINSYMKKNNYPNSLKARASKGTIIIENIDCHGLYAIDVAKSATGLDFQHMYPSTIKPK